MTPPRHRGPTDATPPRPEPERASTRAGGSLGERARLGLGLAHLPAALITAQAALFYAFALRARIALGVWPAPYQPDPKALGFTVHHALTAAGLAMAPFTPVLWALLALAARHVGIPRREVLVGALMFAAAYAAGAALVLADPGELLAWFGD